MLLSRKKLYRIKKTKNQSRRRRKQRNKKKYKRRRKAGSRRKKRALNLRKRTMKSYHKGGFNRTNLSFLVPYWNEETNKQELYLVTHKTIVPNKDDGNPRDFSIEKNTLVNLFLKGHNDNTESTKLLLRKVYYSITRPRVHNIYFHKATNLQLTDVLINGLSAEAITKLNQKLLSEQIAENPDRTTGFTDRNALLANVKATMNVLERNLSNVRDTPPEPTKEPEPSKDNEPVVPGEISKEEDYEDDFEADEVAECDRSRDCKDNFENKLCLPPESGEGKGSCVTKDVMKTTMAARGQATRDARAAAATAVGATGMNPADLFEEDETPGPDDVVPFVAPTDDNSCPTGKHEECDGEQVCINQECVDPPEWFERPGPARGEPLLEGDEDYSRDAFETECDTTEDCDPGQQCANGNCITIQREGQATTDDSNFTGCSEGTTPHPEGKTRSDGSPVCLTPEDLQRLQDRRAAGATGPTEMNLDELYGEGCPEGTTPHPEGKTRSNGSPVCLTPEDLERFQARRAEGEDDTDVNITGLYEGKTVQPSSGDGEGGDEGKGAEPPTGISDVTTATTDEIINAFALLGQKCNTRHGQEACKEGECINPNSNGIGICSVVTEEGSKEPAVETPVMTGREFHDRVKEIINAANQNNKIMIFISNRHIQTDAIFHACQLQLHRIPDIENKPEVIDCLNIVFTLIGILGSSDDLSNIWRTNPKIRSIIQKSNNRYNSINDVLTQLRIIQLSANTQYILSSNRVILNCFKTYPDIYNPQRSPSRYEYPDDISKTIIRDKDAAVARLRELEQRKIREREFFNSLETQDINIETADQWYFTKHLLEKFIGSDIETLKLFISINDTTFGAEGKTVQPTGDDEGKTEQPSIDSKTSDIGPPYNLINVGDVLEVAILRPATRGMARTLAAAGHNMVEYTDPYGSKVGLPIKRHSFEAQYKDGERSLYTLVNVTVASISSSTTGVKYQIEQLSQDVLDNLPTPHGLEEGLREELGYNQPFGKFSGPYRDYVTFDEIIQIVNRPDVNLPTGPITSVSPGNNISPNILPDPPGTGPTGPEGKGDDVESYTDNSFDSDEDDDDDGDDDGDNNPTGPEGKTSGNTGNNNDSGNVVANTLPVNPSSQTGDGSGGATGPQQSQTGDGSGGQNQPSNTNPNPLGGQQGPQGQQGSQGQQGQQGPHGPQGQNPPGGNPPGGNPPTGQGNANQQLPNDPLLYSQPKFTATWQVYPGMYQPGLRVMADTGMGVAEWLRHLGRPNPLPNIQPAVAPGNSGDGGDGGEGKKRHHDDNGEGQNTSRGGGKKKKRKSKKRKSMKKRRRRKGRKSLKRKN